MLLTKITVLLLALACAASVCAQEGEAFLGKWNITATTPTGSYPYWLEVKRENNTLVGYFLNRGGSVLKLPEIKVQNGELTWAVPTRSGTPPVHRAKIVNGKLQGTLTTTSGTINWTGVRPPKWRRANANGKHKFGRPVELFDGTSLASWDVQFKDKPSGWTVVDGAMTHEEKANNLVSKQKFHDVKIEAEY